MDIAEFLLARIAEDEAAATDGWSYGSPARVLAECDAKRRIVELHPDYGWSHCEGESLPCPTACLLALPYAGHPDYDPDWKV